MGVYSYSWSVKAIRRKLDNNDPVYIAAYDKAIEYFEMYDALEKTYHSTIIRSIFGESVNRRKPIDGVAIDRYCTPRTLYRYIHKYVDCIMLYVQTSSAVSLQNNV